MEKLYSVISSQLITNKNKRAGEISEWVILYDQEAIGGEGYSRDRKEEKNNNQKSKGIWMKKERERKKKRRKSSGPRSFTPLILNLSSP